MFKVYCTDHVFEFGRFFGIIATSSQKDGVIAEIYFFAPDVNPPIFEGLIEHISSDIIKADASFVEKEAPRQLKNLANKHQTKAYKKSRDIDIMKPVVFHNTDSGALIDLKQIPKCATNLRAIAKDTSSTPLRNYIDHIFSWTIEIRPYPYKGKK